jgi:hypothetical protein
MCARDSILLPSKKTGHCSRRGFLFKVVYGDFSPIITSERLATSRSAGDGGFGGAETEHLLNRLGWPKNAKNRAALLRLGSAPHTNRAIVLLHDLAG